MNDPSDESRDESCKRFRSSIRLSVAGQSLRRGFRKPVLTSKQLTASTGSSKSTIEFMNPLLTFGILLSWSLSTAKAQLTPSISDYTVAAQKVLAKSLLIAQEVDRTQFEIQVNDELGNIKARPAKLMEIVQFYGFKTNTVKIWAALLKIEYSDHIKLAWVLFLPTPDVFYWLVPPSHALYDIDFQQLNHNIIEILK